MTKQRLNIFLNIATLVFTTINADLVYANYRKIHNLSYETILIDRRVSKYENACDSKSVVRDLIRQLGNTIIVFPSENFLYFRFSDGKNSYSGSLRLGVDARSSHSVEFSCYLTFASWYRPSRTEVFFSLLSAKDGVYLNKISEFKYDLRFERRHLKIVLKQISQGDLNNRYIDGFKHIGNLLDDSGVAFGLLYDFRHKRFFFKLRNDLGVSEDFSKLSDNLFVSKRTGFVFYRSELLKSDILVAVNATEFANNTRFDGPFDQLPENYFKRINFWSYVYDSRPDLYGRLTDGGAYLNIFPPIVFGIQAYRQYENLSDLIIVRRCFDDYQDHGEMLLCITGQSFKH